MNLNRIKDKINWRVVTGIAIGLWLWLTFVLGRWFFFLTAGVFGSIGLLEYFNAFKHKGYHPNYTGGFLGFLLMFLACVFEYSQYYIGIIFIMTIFMQALMLFHKKYTIIDINITTSSYIYPIIPLLLLVHMRFGINYPNGKWLLGLVYVATFATDAFAYWGGKLFGKHPLIPEVSPHKTIEGSICGFIGGVGMTLLVGGFFTWTGIMALPWYHHLAYGILGGITAQIGDLMASGIKRFCGVKDFGSLLPGHGGIIDRIDSLLVTLPVLYFYTLLFIHVR